MTNTPNHPNTSQEVHEANSEQVAQAQETRKLVETTTLNGGEELKSYEKELATKELNKMIEVISSHAPHYLGWVEANIQKDDKTFDEVLAKISSQEDYDGKSYGGDYESIKYFDLWGGLQASVFNNLMSRLGIDHTIHHLKYHRVPHSKLAALALKTVIAKNPKLKKLVEAIASGAAKVGGEEEAVELKNVLS